MQGILYLVETLVRDLRYAVRTLRRDAALTTFAILIIGWDFDGRILLRPDVSGPEQLPLGRLLRSLVEENPRLEVEVLVWSIAVLHAPGAPLPLLLGSDWDQHPRIKVRLDRAHPIYAAHHQKIVTIDDKVAFCGGMDLTVDRWDMARHEPDDLEPVDFRPARQNRLVACLGQLEAIHHLHVRPREEAGWQE